MSQKITRKHVGLRVRARWWEGGDEVADISGVVGQDAGFGNFVFRHDRNPALYGVIVGANYLVVEVLPPLDPPAAPG